MPESKVFSVVATVTQNEIARAFADGFVHYVCTSNRVFWVGEREGGFGLVVFDEVYSSNGLMDNPFCFPRGTSRSMPIGAGLDLVLWRVPSKTPLRPGRVVGVARASREVEPVVVASQLRERFSLTGRHARRR